MWNGGPNPAGSAAPNSVSPPFESCALALTTHAERTLVDLPHPGDHVRESDSEPDGDRREQPDEHLLA